MGNNAMLPKIVMAMLVVAALVTVWVKDGWLVWLPVLLALYVIRGISRSLDH